MRVALVSPYSWSHPGGVNNHLEGLGTELLGHGHEVTIIAPGSGTVPAGIEFVSAGMPVPVRANGSVARLALSPTVYHRVRRALSSGFDIVHVHEPLVPMVSLSAVASARCAVVGTFHAAADSSAIYSLAKFALPRAHSRIDARIAVSEPARELASKYFPGDYEVIPNGVDLSRFSPGAERPERLDGPGPFVLFVGRGERRKGLDVLMRAFGDVKARVPGCRLIVIGEGHERKGGESVIYLGYVKNEELPGYYASADVFCAPALGGESFGIVLAESMASGTPVVASGIPGYRAVLQQAGGGLLFEPGDSEALAGRLLELLSDRPLREKLSRRGLDGVKAFSWESVAGRVEEIYRAAITAREG